MSDRIQRQDAIEAALTFLVEYCGAAFDEDMQKMLCERLDALPSAEPELDKHEWCDDCKEYDQEKHCCHRWNKVIRKTVEEVKSQYALEYPKIIHCEDCKFYTPMNRELKIGICSLRMHNQCDDGFCSDAERRGE